MKYKYDWDKIKETASKEKIELAKLWTRMKDDNGKLYFNYDWVMKTTLNINNEELRQIKVEERKQKIDKIMNNGKFKN